MGIDDCDVRTYIAVMVFFVREISEHASQVSEA
jgi:hypothetical protein